MGTQGPPTTENPLVFFTPPEVGFPGSVLALGNASKMLAHFIFVVRKMDTSVQGFWFSQSPVPKLPKSLENLFRACFFLFFLALPDLADILKRTFFLDLRISSIETRESCQVKIVVES